MITINLKPGTKRAKAGNFGVRTLLMEVIQSPLFTHK